MNDVGEQMQLPDRFSIESAIETASDYSAESVVGVVDETWGETVKAVAVKEEGSNVTEADLKSFVGEKLADFKHPRIYRFVEELPYNANGKLLK